MIVDLTKIRPLWEYFYLPFDEEYSDVVFLDIGDSSLVFTHEGKVIKYYTRTDNPDKFTLSFDFEKNKWMMWIKEEDTSWIPEDGCEWIFYCNNMLNTETIAEESGRLETIT